MSLSIIGPLVSIQWLATNLGSPNLIVLDATMKPVTPNSVATSTVDDVQIPGTRIFDFDKKICDHNTSLPHMMPTPEAFEKEVCALGINKDSVIVVYDRVGTYSSPRAWWMLKSMGHDQVAVLDGGLPAWLEAGHTTEPLATPPVKPGNFVAKPRENSFYNADQVTLALKDPCSVLLDARSAGRFSGKDPEPRPGLRPGHMPGAVNLPFNAVQVNGRMRSIEELKALFAPRLKPYQQLITSCGSGVTACILTLAAEMIGHKNIAVYDGSWCEWGLPSARPVVK